MWWAIWTVSILTALWLLLKKVYSHWSDRGIHHLKPAFFVGNLNGITFRREHLSKYVEQLYHSFPKDRFVGHFEFLSPVLVVRDLELLKKITVKDFDHFMDRRLFIEEDAEPLFSRNLFVMKGHKWRDMRSTLSPAFTGSKMRNMVPFMLECGEAMVSTLAHNIKTSGITDVDTRDLCTRFANDVIASCAFGLKVNSFKDTDNQFFNMGRKATTFDFWWMIKFFGYSSMPKLMKVFKLRMFDVSTVEFFRSLVMDTMRNREQNKIIRPDMIHLLMEAKNGKLQHEKTVEKDTGFATVDEVAPSHGTVAVWSDDDLTGQAMVFFLAGFDGVATAMTFLLYELALNPGVQARVLEEMRQVSDPTYDTLLALKYLDMVVSESLRKWPPVVINDRICVKAYNLGRAHPDSKEDYIIKEGAGIMYPTWAIHRDPAFYPEPEKFDPERFSEENRGSINPYAYQPFGIGPRNCIGSRFALLEMKILTYFIVNSFKLEVSKKTCVPAKLQPEKFSLRLKGGHWLKLTPRV